MKNPKLISKPFAQNGQKNVIPEKYETSMESNQATWDQGFGQITMLPVSAGGLPPKGQDFNGILNQMCETIVHISKGGVFKFSVDYATAINGYPKGAILQSEDEKKYYQSLIDNNKVNFNTASQDQIKTSWKLVMTDDLLDQLSKKLESSAVVQSTGASTTSVMSQKASTDAFQSKGDYLKTGDFGVGGDAVNIPSGGFDGISKTGVYKGTGVGAPPGELPWGSVIHLQRQAGRATQIAFWKGDLATRSCIDGVWGEWISFYSDTNTSKDSNGFLRTGNKTTITTDKLSQGIGVSAEHVMSQKASTEYFALSKYFDYLSSAGEGRVWSGDRKNYLFTNNNKNSGLYNTDSDGYIWGFNSSGVMTAGMIPLNCGGTGARDIASAQNNLQVYSKGYINTELDKKFDKSKISQGIGPSTEHVMSQKACVDSFQPKGSYQPAGNYALKSDLSDVDNIPVGSPIPWSLPTAPSGYLICQGQTFNKSTYPKLAIAYPAGKLPDLRGEFIRGLDAGRGVDAERTALSTQDGNSLLSTNLFNIDNEVAKQFETKIDYIGYTGTDNSGSYGILQQIEGKFGNETRPRNIAFLYIVRAA